MCQSQSILSDLEKSRFLKFDVFLRLCSFKLALIAFPPSCSPLLYVFVLFLRVCLVCVSCIHAPPQPSLNSAPQRPVHLLVLKRPSMRPSRGHRVTCDLYLMSNSFSLVLGRHQQRRILDVHTPYSCHH